jgi:hypothetical protein
VIEKRRPTVSDDVDADKDPAAEDHTLAHDDDEGFEAKPLDDDDHEAYMDHEDDLTADPDIDPEAEAARRKAKSNLIFYGGIAVVVLILVFLAYPQFKKTFGGKPAAQQHVAAGVPVPLKARESKFTLADTNTPTAPPAGAMPSGAIATPPVIASAPAVATQDAAVPSVATPPVAPAQNTTATTMAATPVAPIAAPSVVAPPAMPAMGATASKDTLLPPPAQVKPVESPAVQAPPVQLSAVQATAAQPAPTASVPQAKAADPQIAQMQARIADLTAKLASLQANVATLTADRDDKAARLKQVQASLDSLQSHPAAQPAKAPAAPVQTAKPAVSVKKPVHRPVHHKAKVPSAAPVQAGSDWILRSATPGMALLGQADNDDLQRVSVGDSISGLGRITSISEQNGHWVVKGTGGSVVQ